MVGKKSSRGIPSKISSITAPATSSMTNTPSKSSVLHCLFPPANFQLALFASVIQGFDAQHVRIHDTVTGRLRCDHAIKSKATVTCLDWGCHGKNFEHGHAREQRKKRKRTEQANGDQSGFDGDVLLAFGTSDSEISLLSAAEAKIVGILQGEHVQGIKDFKFTDGEMYVEGWSLGGDGKLVQWDIRKRSKIRVLSSSNRYLHTICPLGSSILYASNIAYLLDPTQGETKSFTASNKPVHTIISSSSNSSQPFSFLTAAETDRFVTVFNTEHPAAVGTLRTENPVQSLALRTSNDTPEKLLENGRKQVPPNSGQILLVVNTDGALEIFPSPFTFGDPRVQKGSETVKSRMKQRTRIRAALVKLARPDKTSTPIPLLDASFQGNDIIMAWTEGGVDLMFDRVQWRDEDNGMLLLDGVKVIVKEKNSASLGAVVMNGVKDMGRNHIDESRTVVLNGDNESAEQMPIEEREVITISSGEESDSDEDDSEAEDNEEDDRNEEDGRRPAISDTDIQMEEVQNHDEKGTNDRQGVLIKVEEDTAMEVEEQAHREDEEPTFGDLIRANAPEPVDVRASAASYERASAPTSERGVDLPSGMSLGAVLTQSLRTNDINLLEICFHEKNLAIIRATIERLDSPLATMLLVKLAERLHSRPGRAGKLMVWIQWTLIAHGGYLTSQPDVMKRLASLYRVVKQRANSLEPLLSLKGKLDMLEAQMNLRKRMQARSRAQNARNEDDDEGVIYVEGQKESGSESEGADPNSPRQIMSTDRLQDDGHSSQSEGDNDDEDNVEDKDAEGEMLRNPNGAIPGLSSDSSDSEEEEGFIDDEASSTDQDSGEDEASSDAIDHESLDSGSDASSSREAPPSKRRAKEVFGHGLEASRQ